MKQPTYIDLLNQYWRIYETAHLTAHDTFIYFLLLKEANGRQWTNPFDYPSRNIEIYSGLPRKTINESRNRLKQAGLIDFKPGTGKGTPPTYTLLQALPRVTRKVTDEVTPKVTEKVTINKDLKTKDKAPLYPPEMGGVPTHETAESNAETKSPHFGGTKGGCHPTLEEVEAYIEEYAQRSGKQPEFTAERWLSYYQSNGWRVGRNPMKDWKAAVRTWFTQQNNYTNNGTTQTTGAAGYGTNHPACITNQSYRSAPKAMLAERIGARPPTNSEQARLERERDAAGIIARLAAQNRLD